MGLSFPDPTALQVAVSGGPLYRLRERFEDAGIGGGYDGPEGVANRPYVRGIERVDLSLDTGAATLGNLWKTVLKNCKVLVEMEGTPEEDSPSAEYVDSMREDAQFVWA